jgi:hypothetical protein
VGDIIAFKKKPAKARGLCQHGFHKWVIWNDKQFDVKSGKLVTVYRCSRCQAQKVVAL